MLRNDGLVCIKYFRLLSDEFTQEKGEVTPTLKLKRKVVDEHNKNILDEMYLETPVGIAVP